MFLQHLRGDEHSDTIGSHILSFRHKTGERKVYIRVESQY